jgi:hypothetical protein
VQPVPGGRNLCQSMLCFVLKLDESLLAQFHQIQAKIDGVSGHDTISVDSEPLDALHMDSFRVVPMCNRFLVANLCLAMLCFGLQLGESLVLQHLIQAKIDGVSGHDTISDVSKPFHALHVDSIGDVPVCNQFLMDNLCQAMLCFGLQLGESLAPCACG